MEELARGVNVALDVDEGNVVVRRVKSRDGAQGGRAELELDRQRIGGVGRGRGDDALRAKLLVNLDAVGVEGDGAKGCLGGRVGHAPERRGNADVR